MRTEQYTESMTANIGDDFDGNDPEQVAAIKAYLDRAMVLYVSQQYRGRRAPVAIMTDPAEWTITDSIDVVRKYKPIHECPTCLEALELAKRHLAANPERWVAIADVTYTCVWR